MAFSKTGIITLPLYREWTCRGVRRLHLCKLSENCLVLFLHKYQMRIIFPIWALREIQLILERQQTSSHRISGGEGGSPKNVLLSNWTFPKRVIELGRGGRYGGRLR